MARVSFTVRNSTSGSAGGSYLRYPDGSASPGLFPARTDYDSALRDDGVQSSPTVSAVVSTFTATPITYGTVELDWFTTISTASLTPSVTSVLLVYSPRGVPQTVLSGTVLIDSGSVFTYNHTGLPQGKWAYYSLFAHYTTSDSSSDYYYKLAELEVLVPTDYGSTLLLWEQLPAFARVQDTALGNYSFSTDIGLTTLNALGFTYDAVGNVVTLGDPVGPLLKFLSIVGFDMDGIRTLIDYIMVAKDPEIANTETLNALASTLGTDITTLNLGDSRLRNVLDNIGTYRRSKGTLSAAILILSAISGSNVTLNTTTRQFTIYAQRANYITVPKTGTGLVTWRVSDNSEIVTPQVFSFAGYNAHSGDVTLSGQTWTSVTTANGITGAMIKLSSNVPVLLGDSVYFSVSSTTPTKLQWARLVTAGGVIVGWGQTAKTINGVNYVEIDVTTGTNPTTFTNTTMEFRVDVSSGPFIGQNYLVEANNLGTYFDGDTVRGGWLVDNFGSVADFAWSGTKNASVSTYSEDFSRTVGAVKDIFPQVLPIQVSTYYSINAYKQIRGF